MSDASTVYIHSTGPVAIFIILNFTAEQQSYTVMSRIKAGAYGRISRG